MRNQTLLSYLTLALISIFSLAGCGGSSSGSSSPVSGSTQTVAPAEFLVAADTLGRIVSLKVNLGDGTLGTPQAYHSNSFQPVPIFSNAIAVDSPGKFVFVADDEFEQGIFGFGVNQTTGVLEELAWSPAKFSATATTSAALAVDPKGRFLYLSDSFGIPTKIRSFTINQQSGIISAGAIISPPSSQFTQATVDPAGKFLYVVDFGSGIPPNISAFAIDQSSGTLQSVPGSPFTTPDLPQSVAVHPSGKFLYTCLARSSKGVVGFSVDATTGALTPIGGSPFASGNQPSFMAINPSGRFAYIANIDGIYAYSINQTTGALTLISGSPFSGGWAQLLVDPSGKFLYNLNYNPGTVFAFSVDQNTGALSPVAGSPFITGFSGASQLAIVQVP
jgi:6-phosphogluconolactonase (cycloisomerase 2 family)